jgi:flagellin-like hook-associated protein FlgL
MRVTQSMEQTQFLTALNQLESSISTTQNGISTGLAFTTASQNPVGAGLVAGYNQVLAQSQQYTSNGNSATGSLNTEAHSRNCRISCRACVISRSRPTTPASRHPT